MNINVAPVNDAPDAVDDSFSTNEDAPLNITAAQLLANDTDLDGDTLSVTSVDSTTANGGTVTYNAVTGAITYTLAANYNGSDSLTYTISDGNGGTDTATVNINVAPVNDAPDAVDDGAHAQYILLGTKEIAGSMDDWGTENADGSVSFSENGINGTIQAFSNNGNNSDVEFSIGQSGGGNRDYGIGVNGGGSKEIDLGESVVISFDTVLTSAKIGLDSLFSHFNSGSSKDARASWKAYKNGVLIASGEVLNDPANTDGDGKRETNMIEVNQAFDSLEFETVSPTSTANSNFVIRYIEATTGGEFITDEDVALTIDDAIILNNDSDPDGDAIRILNVGTTSANGGAVSYDSVTGEITYTPALNFNGTDSFAYTITDDNGGTDTATVHLYVNPINDAPEATDDTFSGQEDTSLNFTLANILNNDNDVDGDSLSLHAFDASTSLGGTLSYNALTQTFTYNPAADVHGRDSMTYTISDGNGGYSTATIYIDLVDTPDPTEAPELSLMGKCYSFGEDIVNLVTSVNLTDVDSTNLTSAQAAIKSNFQAGDVLQLNGLSITAGVVDGTNIQVSYNSVTGVLDLSGSDTLASYKTVLGALQFDSNGNEGTRDIEVTVTDDSGASSNIATVSANVTTGTLEGTAGDDSLAGTSENNAINGNAGNDSVQAYDGNDSVHGNDGNDTVYGGSGEDALFGDAGNDTLYGDDPSSSAVGYNDCLHGGDGKDTLYGFGGHDYLEGGNGQDILYGGAGNDKLVDYGAAINVLHTYNVVFVVDISGSMGWTDSYTGGQTRYELLQQAISDLVADFESDSYNVSLSLVTFNGGVSSQVFADSDFTSLTTAINGFNKSGATRFSNALDLSKTLLDSDISSAPTTDTHHNLMYFISDGAPSYNYRESDLGYDWSDYVDANNIDSHAVTIGSGALTYMNPIDNTGGAEYYRPGDDLSLNMQKEETGNDALYGEAGDDYIDGGLGSDSLYGGSGDDTLVFDANDSVIDGGTGNDTLFIQDTTTTLDFGHFGMNAIDHVDMTNETTTTLELTSVDVMQNTDSSGLVISGDTGDIVDASEYTVRGSDETHDGVKYARYDHNASGSSILVEVGLELNGSTVTEQ